MGNYGNKRLTINLFSYFVLLILSHQPCIDQSLYFIFSPFTVYWKLDKTENMSRMRLKLRRNYNFNDHRDAVIVHKGLRLSIPSINNEDNNVDPGTQQYNDLIQSSGIKVQSVQGNNNISFIVIIIII